MNIYLIGYRCTGKTTVGKSLADRLNWSFLDADVELVNQHDMSIAEIVAGEGWDSFRKKEKAIIRDLSALNQHVIATGGGVILNAENVRQMKKSGIVVWLQAAAETIQRRMACDHKTADLRPALTSKDLKQEIEETLAERQPLYERAMDFSVQTDNLEIDEICSAILANIEKI